MNKLALLRLCIIMYFFFISIKNEGVKGESSPFMRELLFEKTTVTTMTIFYYNDQGQTKTRSRPANDQRCLSLFLRNLNCPQQGLGVGWGLVLGFDLQPNRVGMGAQKLWSGPQYQQSRVTRTTDQQE